MKANTGVYFRKSYDDFKKRPLFVTLFYIMAIAGPIMLLERFIFPGMRFDINILKEYFVATFSQSPIKSVLLFLLVEPVIEELTYRGPVRVLDWLFSKFRFNIYFQAVILAIAIALQAHLWAASHVGPLGFLAVGIILGVLVVKSRRLWVAIATHIIFNVLAFIGMLVSYWLF